MAEAVRICDEFVQVEGGKPSVANIDADEGETPKTSNSNTELQLLLATVKELMQAQGQIMKDLAQTKSQAVAPPKRKIECFNCGGPHLKRNCPALKSQTNNTNTVSQSENSDSPAQ
jgi:hypothetical protein